MRPAWHPETFARKTQFLYERAALFARVRTFFTGRGYLEVETPTLQTSPCMEPHLRAFETLLRAPDGQSQRRMFLHTSPELAMKKLLVAGLPKIFQICKTFRNAEGSAWHSPEFTMLEWYQAGMTYEAMMEETTDLLRHALPTPVSVRGKMCDVHQAWEKISVTEAVARYAGIALEGRLEDREFLESEARRIGVYISPHDDWSNALLKIMMDRVESHLGMGAPTILYDYPVCMAALSRPKPSNPILAERFEVYIAGIEIANAFGELTDGAVQRARFLHDVSERKILYGEDYPVDEDFLNAIDAGLPPCSGNALGMDRLAMLAAGVEDIALVQALPV